MSVAPQPGQRYSPQYWLGYGAGQRARRQGEPPLTPWSEQRWPLPAAYDRGFRAGYAAAGPVSRPAPLPDFTADYMPVAAYGYRAPVAMDWPTLAQLAERAAAEVRATALADIALVADLYGESRWTHRARVRLWYGGLR